MGRAAIDRGRSPLGGLKSDECIEDGGSDPSRTRILEVSEPPNTDRDDDRDFGSSRSLQDKLVELPSTSSSLHGPHFEPPQTPKCPELAPTKLGNNLATEFTKLSKAGISNQPMNLRLVRRNARSA